MKNIIKFSALLVLFASCDEVFEPALENGREIESMYEEPGYAQGFLANAYILLPYSVSPESDVATDDAVSNDINNNYLKMATGSWTSDNDPVSQWNGRYNAIQYINLFLENVDKVEWAKEVHFNTMFNDRLKGESYGLRALHMYHLLRAHGGKTADGRLMGVPIILESEGAESDFNHPRATYAECIEQIISDATKAIELLPTVYKTFSNSEIPAKYQALGVANASAYNRVCGEAFRGLMSGQIASAVLAQATLMAASPAFAESGTTWADAANNAAAVLDIIGGPSGIDPQGGVWYVYADKATDYGLGGSPAEIIWRGAVDENNTLEVDNFPPSLYGNGRVNPTQNLVDAFPMLNGYPISESGSEYNAAAPYANRDPRLNHYIVYNGSTQGPSDATITTASYGTNTDAINKESGKSTRTGYYLRKLMRKECNPNPQSGNKAKHYIARIRYTEMFLAYAEAANEAWGPTGTGTHSYSAYDVIKAIRARAGVGTTNGDAYLESVKGSKDLMRELIRNERRLELCFENFRFWDLRRWNMNLNEAARGVQITQSGGATNYVEVPTVEVRSYRDYMNYGPIPYSEVFKFSNLDQNVGW